MPPAPALDTFETHRRFLTRLAYRMLGSVSDAEDVVQDAWLRWREVEQGGIEAPRAYLARTVSRLCLDRMKSARNRREFYVGSWLPEPLVERLGAAPGVDEGIDAPVALMLALERLSPLERAAFLLHDVFDMEFAEVARIVERSESACRQLAKRARAHVRIDVPPRHPIAPEEARRYVEAFFAAAHQSDPAALKALLAESVTLVSDGGGKVIAVMQPVIGADRVARFFAGIAGKNAARGAPPSRFEPVLIDGMPGYVSLENDTTLQATALDIRDGRIHTIYAMRNPDKLRHLSAPPAPQCPVEHSSPRPEEVRRAVSNGDSEGSGTS